MSSIVSTLLGGGNSGVNYQPTAAPIAPSATTDQANQQYLQTQSGLEQQQALLKALQGQNGLQNQTNVYNQMQGVANGTGANPAQAMLNNATGQNVANQSALMAGQRGANANVGLMARQAANQGAQTQQQAAGQAAALQANQQLNALGQMGGMANQQAGQQIGAQNAYNQAAQNQRALTLQALQGQNAQNVAMQSNMNQVQGQMASGAQQGQFGAVGGLMNAAGSALPMAGNAVKGLFSSGTNTGYNSATDTQAADVTAGNAGNVGQNIQAFADGGSVSDPYGRTDSQGVFQPLAKPLDSTSSIANSYSAPQAPQAPQGPSANETLLGTIGSIGGGIIGGIYGGGYPGAMIGSTAGGALGRAIGKNFAEGGKVPNSSSKNKTDANGETAVNCVPRPDKGFGAVICKADGGAVNMPKSQLGNYMTGNHKKQMFAQGGKVPALVSPGEQYIPPKDLPKVKNGKSPLNVGERIPGNPKHLGNDYRNDTVPKTLQSGGVVIPNEIMQSPDRDKKAREFVNAVLAKSKHKRSK